MGSLRYGGVSFQVYMDDHAPPHVHARYGEMQAILELKVGGRIALAKRSDALLPPNAKQSDLRRVIALARAHDAELRELWRAIHG